MIQELGPLLPLNCAALFHKAWDELNTVIGKLTGKAQAGLDKGQLKKLIGTVIVLINKQKQYNTNVGRRTWPPGSR